MSSGYRLDRLGWLQFERLCSLVLEHEAGLAGLRWAGHADTVRVALVEQAVSLTDPRARLAAPLAVAVVWARERATPAARMSDLLSGAALLPDSLGGWPDRVLVLTNLEGAEAARALADRFSGATRFVVMGTGELGRSFERHAALRVAMPSVLGLGDPAPLIDGEALARSSFALDAARELAGVFWATGAYDRARDVLARHRFVVLTGPPEMGKTAIARMLALAKLTDGWEAHECNSPEQVWRAFAAERRQVFVADDAFGSTEYRPDAAERWARELGRLLRSLDDGHWLIWTSRPAPLKAGLRRVQREAGAERFPAPGEVVVDASHLELSEKTLILFRHAKCHRLNDAERGLLRAHGVAIVEHPHFTPERIRRFVSERLDALPVAGAAPVTLERIVERELTEPTLAMRSSFRALGDEHRELLVALLDAPAGLIDERALAATVRRHHTGGLSRPPATLIDRLTDHFLRVSGLGIGWVHPSWRDLVIEELQDDGPARRAFLSRAGIEGTLLALSRGGGAAGTRSLPLLCDDSDWDTLGDRLAELVRELEERDLNRLLLGLADVLRSALPDRQWTELDSLCGNVLSSLRHRWARRVVPVFLLEDWHALNQLVSEPVQAPAIGFTWAELRPTEATLARRLGASELRAIDEWLALAQVLAAHDRDALTEVGFYGADRRLLERLAWQLGTVVDLDIELLAKSILSRIRDLSPDHGALVRAATTLLRHAPREERWWVPEDISAPPSDEPVAHVHGAFTRVDVERVLGDL